MYNYAYTKGCINIKILSHLKFYSRANALTHPDEHASTLKQIYTHIHFLSYHVHTFTYEHTHTVDIYTITYTHTHGHIYQRGCKSTMTPSCRHTNNSFKIPWTYKTSLVNQAKEAEVSPSETTSS